MSGNKNNKKEWEGQANENTGLSWTHKMAAWSQCSLARETLSLYQPGRANGREILSLMWGFPDWLTEITHSPCHPHAHHHIHTHSPTHADTLSHQSMWTVWVLSVDCTVSSSSPYMFSANGFFQMLLEDEKTSPLLFYVVSTLLFLVVSGFHTLV